ncbi:UTP--glucose-1-phosphate uridylyltransferase [Planctomicrobium sp. SH661]|uniref:UTP--glucose-1-phosphate uridylyltransferase n=1 Tax=Planctomicrobium sp. SH661 TaxID=3448124 RepID=UPI003F5BC34D
MAMQTSVQVPRDILLPLQQAGQEHLVQFWDELNPSQQQTLAEQIQEIDFPLMQRLIAQAKSPHSAGESVADKAARATSPQQLVRIPRSQADREQQKKAGEIGKELLSSGKVGAILVAGGQGSRLGFDEPKGMFPIGPVSDRTLFQIHCEQILARSLQVGAQIPYFIMTSEATHRPTVKFFEQNRYFGLSEDNVFFFQQSSLPAVDAETGKMLMERKDRIGTSPDGHGGMLRALERSGMLGVMRDREIEHLYYHQVDNPTAIVCDPVLLGHHLLSHSDLTTKVVAKVSPEEKMGVLASVDGKTEIIEYSDLPVEQSKRKQADGTLVFWAGNTAIHVFKRRFIEKLLGDELSLPFHVAHKKVACLDESGNPVSPSEPNAFKFEQFIFDALPHAKVALVVEGSRKREFNPVKNAEGSDSPATSRAALLSMAREWIEAAGGIVEKDVPIEISPLFALDAHELQTRLDPGQIFKKPTVLE